MTTPTTVQVRMQLRADTAANWTSINPTLLSAEIGLERDTNKIKIGDGTTAWNSLGYFPFVVSGGVVTGNLEIGTTGTLTFEGSSADGFETTLAVVNPTADRTITLPNVTGTVITTGDTGTVTSTMIADGTIVNADISATAEIAVSKLADGAARQLLQTDAAGTGVEWTDNVDVPGTLDVTGAATFDNNVTVQGDLTVNGTTTTIDTQNLLVEDKNVVIGNVTSPTDVTADGGGITLKGTTDKTISWSDTTNAWTSSEVVDIPAGTAGAPSLIFGADVNSGLFSPGADQVAISTGGTGRLFIDASGNVGVGVASPVTTLHLQKTTGGLAGVQISTSTHGSTGTDGLFVGIDNSLGYLWNYENLPLVFGTNSTERLRITSDGKLGLGTSSPGATLDVAGTIRVQGFGSTTDNNFASYEFFNTDPSQAGPNVSAAIRALAVNSDGSGSHLAFHSSLGTESEGANAPERLRITGAGNVGIGTTAPNRTLQVAGATAVTNSADTGAFVFDPAASVNTLLSRAGQASTTAVDLAIKMGNTEAARIDSSGRLLVGASASSGSGSKIQVVGDSGLQVHRGINSSSASIINISKSRNTTYGSNTIVQANDAIGLIAFRADDGTDYLTTAAQILAEVDGTPGADQMPGRIVFSTNSGASGASPTERLRITSAGVLQIADAGDIAVGTTTGTKIGTATTQKLGFFNKTPVVQPTAVANATDAASVITQLNALLSRMRDLGLIAT